MLVRGGTLGGRGGVDNEPWMVLVITIVLSPEAWVWMLLASGMVGVGKTEDAGLVAGAVEKMGKLPS